MTITPKQQQNQNGDSMVTQSELGAKTTPSGTPRTDAHLSHLNLPDGRKIGIPNTTVELLRQLEAELSALSQQLKEAQEKLAKGNLISTADLGNHPSAEGG